MKDELIRIVNDYLTQQQVDVTSEERSTIVDKLEEQVHWSIDQSLPEIVQEIL